MGDDEPDFGRACEKLSEFIALHGQPPTLLWTFFEDSALPGISMRDGSRWSPPRDDARGYEPS